MPFQTLLNANDLGVKPTTLQTHVTAQAALDELLQLYNEGREALTKSFHAFAKGDLNQVQSPNACYPFVGIVIESHQLHHDVRLSYSVVDHAGIYATTITRPDLFYTYYYEQIDLLIQHYQGPIYTGLSHHPYPLPFIIDRSHTILTAQQTDKLKLNFFHPDLKRVDDHIVNHTFNQQEPAPRPLALFTGERVDFSLQRLQHYTGTDSEHFQNFILLTNYQRYIREFIEYSRETLDDDNYYEFVEPNNVCHRRDPVTHQVVAEGQSVDHLPQMPAYHLKRRDGNGITLINIGVGPSNAKTITDHLAVLRPHCWLMLGHCAGLRSTQQLGDYVLAHGYVREDHVLDQDLPLWVPVPALAEIQMALQDAVAEVTGLQGHELKYRMRTGTVFTTDNRNWELRSQELYERFNQSRSIAVDMESATIAANGLRFRVPYGTLLCVSDKPIQGEIKLKGMATAFYEERVGQHLKIGIKALEIIRSQGMQSVHSRKLRGFDEPAFR